MDASQYMKYKVRSISSFISRSGCTESGLRTWSLSQAVNTYYTSPNQQPQVQANTFNYSNLNISTQQYGNSLPYTDTLASTRVGYGGADYVLPIQPPIPNPSCGIIQSDSNFYLPPFVIGGTAVPYNIPAPYQYSGNPAPYANPLVYLSTAGACDQLPSFQGTLATKAMAVGNCADYCDVSASYPSTIVPGASAYGSDGTNFILRKNK